METESDIHSIGSQEILLFLKQELDRRIRNNSNYSLRAYAKYLEIDNSTLSKILLGKRPIGKKLATRILTKFGINGGWVKSALEEAEDSQYLSIEADTYQLISSWQNYAVLELMRVDGFRPDIKWISQRLNLSEEETQEVVERLVRVGFIEVQDDGNWVDLTGEKTTHILKAGTDSARKNHQKEILSLSVKAIDEVPYELRSHTSMTFAIDTEKLNEAKRLIKNFRRDLGKLLSRGGKRDEVYHLAVSLYPVSHNEKNHINSSTEESI